MEILSLSPEYTLRPANKADAARIRQIISLVKINPLSLNWQRFILAVDRENNVIGCGQVKLHNDGSLELASIAVLPGWRVKGIARKIIEQLIKQYPGTLYLTCRSQLGPMYQKFGFQAIQPSDMSPYFKRLSRMVALINKLFHQPDHLLVMKRN